MNMNVTMEGMVKELEKQLSFVPQLGEGLSPKDLPKYDNVIVGGMGGSALAARSLFFLDPIFPAWLHDDFGKPLKNEDKTLYIAISYSGNTAETLSFAQVALANNNSFIAITSGGKLLELAKENGSPYILVPSGFNPRDAVVYMLRAFLYVLGKEKLLKELAESSVNLQETFEQGRAMGRDFEKKIPLIYASRSNYTLAYLGKIMLNETGKIPAFINYFPELMHNEAQGIIPQTAGILAGNLKILLLLDKEDDERLRRVMEVFQGLASSQGVDLAVIELPRGKTNKLVFMLALASGAARTIAELHGVNPDEIPFITSFKKLLG